jgi:hypothetical protein
VARPTARVGSNAVRRGLLNPTKTACHANALLITLRHTAGLREPLLAWRPHADAGPCARLRKATCADCILQSLVALGWEQRQGTMRKEKRLVQALIRAAGMDTTRHECVFELMANLATRSQVRHPDAAQPCCPGHGCAAAQCGVVGARDLANQ